MQNILNDDFSYFNDEEKIFLCLSKGVKVGTDIFKTSIPLEPFLKFLSCFKSTKHCLDIPNPIYFKSLIKKIQNNKVSIKDLYLIAGEQEEYYSGSYVFDVSKGIISDLLKNQNSYPIGKYLTEERDDKEKQYIRKPRTGKGVSIVITDKSEKRILLGLQKKRPRDIQSNCVN